ncbi:MAG: transketolase [Ignavibacteria bacterium]|nr:transketolase [Ignavibacteria bacterium]
MNYDNKLKDIVLKDERIIVLTAEDRSALKTLPLYADKRFIDTGINEMTMIGVATGFALRGRIPICHCYSAFMTMRAFEFIRSDIGIANLPVKLVGSYAGIQSGPNGPTHQALEDISLMRGIPNMKIFCPADLNDLLICIETIINEESPYYIRYNARETNIEHDKNFEIGKAEKFGSGKDIAILVYGYLFNEAFEVKNLLEKNNIGVSLINLRTLKPIDENIIVECLKSYKLVVTIEDHFVTGGLFTILSEIALKNKLCCEVLPIAFENRWFKPSTISNVLEFENLTPPSITMKIKQKLKSIN